MSVDQLRNSPVFKNVPEAPQKPISLSFWYNLLIAAASAFCLIIFKSFYWTGGAVIFSLAVLNIGGFLIERKRANLALKYNENKEIADAQLEKYREMSQKKETE